MWEGCSKQIIYYNEKDGVEIILGFCVDDHVPNRSSRDLIFTRDHEQFGVFSGPFSGGHCKTMSVLNYATNFVMKPEIIKNSEPGKQAIPSKK